MRVTEGRKPTICRPTSPGYRHTLRNLTYCNLGFFRKLLRSAVLTRSHRPRLSRTTRIGISVPAVKSRLLRARLALREKLTRQFKRKGDDLLGYL